MPETEPERHVGQIQAVWPADKASDRDCFKTIVIQSLVQSQGRQCSQRVARLPPACASVLPSGQRRASLVAQMVKNLPAMQEAGIQSLGQEDPLGKGMATHSSILAWRIPWTEEPGRL